MKTPAYILADWGTTSFRLWTVDRDGAVLAEARSPDGMASLSPADYPSALSAAAAAAGADSRTPVLICGMAGAAQGWREAPYLDAGGPLRDIPAAAVAAPMPGWDVRILPGVALRDAARPNVMRGEETLLLGAVLAHGASGAVCLPGTHSKWVQIADGRIASFRTAMTGEVFGLLVRQSTLKHFMGEAQTDSAAEPAFAAAVVESLAAPEALLNALFSLRAGPLLFPGARPAAVQARLSGLLIGAELAANRPTGPVTLVASGGLQSTYAAAFQIAGIAHTTLDSDACARSGLLHAARLIWPDGRSA